MGKTMAYGYIRVSGKGQVKKDGFVRQEKAIRDYAKYKANDLLNWYVLEWGAKNGFKCFDFGGAGKPDQDYGPRRFKAKFNGTLVNYGRNTCVHHPLRLRFSEWGYEVYRRYLIQMQMGGT